ncbi:MAG TPA: hypothetical protein PKA20_05700 [Burkholderiaceae bacterium]|nr:hypothetical protein [Burkholderiaceae bacterium]
MPRKPAASSELSDEQILDLLSEHPPGPEFLAKAYSAAVARLARMERDYPNRRRLLARRIAQGLPESELTATDAELLAGYRLEPREIRLPDGSLAQVPCVAGPEWQSPDRMRRVVKGYQLAAQGRIDEAVRLLRDDP